MANIYETTDNITPAISFHKSIAVDGGIVAKSASLGDSQCRLVVNDDGVYIIIPSRFGDDGNLSAVNYRKYSLGAMVEAIQELNRRTAWMEPNMTFSESLNGTDIIEDSAVNPGVMHGGLIDLLPELKRTIPDGNHFMLINTNGEAVRFYEITDENLLTAVSDAPLMTNNSDYLTTISDAMDTDYTNKYISPRISKITDNSFEILLLDTVGDGNGTPSEFSDKYYTYTLIDKGNYKASLKNGVTIEDILMSGNRITPPVPYIGNINYIVQYSVTSFAGLFKDCTELKGNIDLSEWDFSRITDMSHMFEGCSNITSIYFGNNDFDKVTNTEYLFTGASSLETVKVYMDAPHPVFVKSGIPDTLYIVKDGIITDIPEGGSESVNYTGFVWNKSNDSSNPNYCRFNYTAGLNDHPYKTLTFDISYALNKNDNILTKVG